MQDLKDWENEKRRIIGDNESEECLNYFERENEYLRDNIDAEYTVLRQNRDLLFLQVYQLKKKLVGIFEEIYRPVEVEIRKLLGELEETIAFEAEMQMIQSNFAEQVLSSISQRYAGLFKGKVEASNKMSKLLKQTDFNDESSVIELVSNIMLAVDEDIDNSERKIMDKENFYDSHSRGFPFSSQSDFVAGNFTFSFTFLFFFKNKLKFDMVFSPILSILF